MGNQLVLSEKDTQPIKTDLSEIIEFWKNLLLSNRRIRIIKNKEELPEIKFNRLYENFDFAVYFPRSIFHLNGFKDKLPKATAEAIFLKNGDVYVTLVDDHPQTITKDVTAWKNIISRSTGKEFLEIRSFNILLGSSKAEKFLFSLKKLVIRRK